METLQCYESTDGNRLQTPHSGVCSPPCGDSYTLHWTEGVAPVRRRSYDYSAETGQDTQKPEILEPATICEAFNYNYSLLMGNSNLLIKQFIGLDMAVMHRHKYYTNTDTIWYNTSNYNHQKHHRLKKLKQDEHDSKGRGWQDLLNGCWRGLHHCFTLIKRWHPDKAAEWLAQHRQRLIHGVPIH